MDAKDFMNMTLPSFDRGKGLEIITRKQNELINQYIKIEGFPAPPWNMAVKDNQVRAKGFIFRVIEELGEAFESFEKEDEHNFTTELADAMHFIIELGIVVGHPSPEVPWRAVFGEPAKTFKYPEDMEYNLRQWFWDTTYQLTMVSNLLRNKEWKQTQVHPDFTRLHAQLDMAFLTFFNGFRRIGMTEHQVVAWYTYKNEANKFRIKSKY